VTDWSGGGGYGGPNPVGPGGPPQPPMRPESGPQPWPAAPQPERWSSPLQPPQSWQAPAPGSGPGGPGVAGPPPGVGAVGPPGPFGPPPRRNRRPLLITLGAGAAVLVVIVVVLVITLAGGNSGRGGGSAADAVKGYLAALARGDAEAALSYSDDQPASKDFLTDDVLKKQIAKWPISNIRILNDDSSAASIGMGQVHVAANFGDKVSDATLRTKRNNKRWYLESAAIKLRPTPGSSVNGADKTLTLLGKPLNGDTTYVFPGYVDIGSSNPYIGVKAQPLLLDSLTSYTPWIQAEYSLNDAGAKAVNDALAAAFAACQTSTALGPPPPCPLQALDPYDYVEGTAHWGKADLSKIKISVFDQYHLNVMFMGEVTVPVNVQSKSGRVGDGTVTPFLSGNADISKVPPTLTYR
jgi:hypothetical protein